MPTTVSYPGVYVEEISSGVRTITGVATSICAFVGKAVRGPVDTATTLTSYADFERVFGGLDPNLPMGYTVRDFFANGGSQAVVVRLYKQPAGMATKATIPIANLELGAAWEGAWGNQLRGRISMQPATDLNLKAAADRLGLAPGDLFDLTVYDGVTKTTETFLNLSTKDSARRADRVLLGESRLVRINTALPANATPAAGTGNGTDADVWTNNNKSIPAKSSPASSQAADSDALVAADYQGSQQNKTAIFALEQADLFNLLCIAADTRGGDVPAAAYQTALDYCFARRAILLVDAPSGWKAPDDVLNAATGVAGLGLNGEQARNAAIYYPRIRQSDPMLGAAVETFASSGTVAGVIARTDATRGVWKAPAGTDASLNGVLGLANDLTDNENGLLNPQGVNVLRTFPTFGRVVWGARTMRGADSAADEYKYLPVRRTALYLEESLYRGLKWVVFEPNDEPLWSQIRLNVGAFMHNLFRQGAFQGNTPKDAYLVKCDQETTTQNDINLGIVNILVGFAPLKPAEFVIIQIQQLAGQIQT